MNIQELGSLGEFITRTLAQPGGKHYWDKHSHMFDPQFVRFVEGLQSQNRAATQ